MLKRFYYFIFLQKTEFFLGTTLIVFAMVAQNISPFFVKWITQSVQLGEISETYFLVGIFALIILIGNALDNLGVYFTDRNAVHTSTTISQKILAHIHSLDFAYHTDKSSGKLISLMKRGDEAFYSYYDILNRQILYIIVSFIVMFTAFSQIKLHYILYVFGLIALSIVISIKLVKINIAKRKIFNDADDDLSSARVDNLVNFDTVKYFANETYEQKRFAHLSKKWGDALMGYFFTFRYFDIILGNIINLALCGILLLGLWDLQRNAITFPDFLLITTFALTLFPKMMNLLFSLRELAKKYTDLKVYLELLDEKISVLDPENPTHIQNALGDIKFENVSFRYNPKGPHILKNFNLHIKSGESVAFVGYSGAGKTTIAKLLMRMYDPQEGSIIVDGVPINQMKKSELRTVVGIVPQDPLLFNNTIYYNIAYAKQSASEEEVIHAAKKAQVDEFIKHLSDGYQTVVGERGIKLSGGQRQRLAVARVLLEQPQIVVFDEATSSLDSVSEKMVQKAFWDMIRNAKKPRTSIIVAHRLSTIMRADRIVVMDKGEIVEEGDHESLINKEHGIYHKLWSLQKNGFIGDGESEE